MIYNLVKWAAKVAFLGVIWVFIFSARFEERTLFSILHGYLVKNAVITNLTQELTFLWDHTTASSKTTISKIFDGENSAPPATAEIDDELDKG